ncbi:hypothetical protein NDK50_13845 [Paraburkholderia bryophila]|uniref:hypothetical protein n=1 Tax=Paraburkholderia bryophila TaxID=420952 RepID=UPI0023490D49|nr:hypothetical protein [Paraburkholderia bryophila]WCM18529.1 hypothetical protein NDK50_13845 [Paraburkholderia bryophila]
MKTLEARLSPVTESAACVPQKSELSRPPARLGKAAHAAHFSGKPQFLHTTRRDR